MCDSWEDIDKEKLECFKTNSVSRTLLRHIDEAKQFISEWLSNENTMREDYLKLAILCLTYLGGDLLKNITKLKLRAPSALCEECV